MDTIDKQGVLEVGGHVFKRVKSGLDESQVVTVVQSLLDEREELSKRQGHFTSLMKLAEKMISDADNLAEQIKTEAQAKAESEAQALAARTEEEARQKADAMIAEAMDKANKEAETIKQVALRERHESLKEQAERLQAQLNHSANGICQRMLAQAEAFTRELVDLQAEFGMRISNLSVDGGPPETEPVSDLLAAGVSAGDPGADADMVAQASLPVMGPDVIPPLTPHQTPSPDGRYVEIEILPPRDTVKIRNIETFLKNMPEVETHELENFVDKTSIRVLLRGDANLRERLAGHAAVKEAVEVNDKGQRIVRVSLNVKSSIDDTKDALSRDIGRMLTRK